MARMKVREGRAAPTPTLVAAGGLASAIPNKKERNRRSIKARAWQARAWDFYDSVGELRYAVNWFSSALSRADLYIARLQPDGSLERVEDGPGVAALSELLSRGSTRLLKKMGQHYFIAGEWYLIGRPVEGTEDNSTWDVYSASEVKYLNGTYTLSGGEGIRGEELDEDEDAIIRLLVPHPARHAEPDSPVRAVLGDLEEIQLLTSHIRAQILSRLAGAGILVLPSEMSFGAPPVVGGTVHNVDNLDDFMSLLGRVMSEPIKDPSSPSSVVPIVIQAPGEVIDKITHLKFWSDLDAEAAKMRETATGRLALGLDLPPEVLTGTGAANHWGAWAIEESTIKAHIEPALDLICEQLSIEFLQAVTDDPTLVIAYDTTDLKLRPNRSKEALELHERGELSPVALRRETGFTEDDKPSDEDLERFVLMTMAKGSATPLMVATAAKMLGIEGIEAEPERDYMREERPPPTLRDFPEQGPPTDIPPELAGACEAVVLRAMERAGNRMKNGLPQTTKVAACDLYRHVKVSHNQIDFLLEDAWSMLDHFVPAHELERYQAGLTTYAHRLLRTQEPISRQEMLECLKKTS